MTGAVLLQAIAAETRAAVLRRYAPDSCIATTRTVIEVARYFGITCRPWPADVRLYNPAGWHCARLGLPPAEWPAGAYGLAIDAGPGSADVGHLAAVTTRGPVTRDGDYLIDASLDQAARPAHGAGPFTPVVAALPAGLHLGRPRAQQVEYEIDGCRAFYCASGSVAYLTSPNWGGRDTALIRECAGEAIRAVRTAMSEPRETMTAGGA